MASRSRLVVIGDVSVPDLERHISVERFLGISYSKVDAKGLHVSTPSSRGEQLAGGGDY